MCGHHTECSSDWAVTLLPAHLHGLLVLSIDNVNLVTVHDCVVGRVCGGNPLSRSFLLDEMGTFALITDGSILQWRCVSVLELELLLQPSTVMSRQ